MKNVSDQAVPHPIDPWRSQAAAIVEELLLAAPTDEIDRLLDFRRLLLRGGDWSDALDLFLAIREALESRHYLPVYRLRNLLAARLRFDPTGWEGVDADLRRMLRLHYRSLRAMREALDRERFEKALPDTGMPLRVVEI